MFEQVKRFTAYIQFEFAFQKFERLARKAHYAQADLQYSTAKLEKKVLQIRAQIQHEISRQFGTRRQQLAKNIFATETEISEIVANLSVFQRHYKSEIQPKYDELEVIKAKLQRLYEAKNEAYDELNSAKDSIDTWYAKSDRYFFGNKNRKIPQHSFFGQSHGDLHEFKKDRDAAYFEIRTISEDIERLKSRRATLRLLISAIKRDCERMRDLQNQGTNAKKLSIELSQKKSELAPLRDALTSHDNEVIEATLAKENEYGLFESEAQIESLKEQKAEFIASFSTDRARLKRRALLKRNQKTDERGDG